MKIFIVIINFYLIQFFEKQLNRKIQKMSNIVYEANTSILGPRPPNSFYVEGRYVIPGQVWVWGLGKEGILGVPTDNDGHVCFPLRVPKLNNVIHVAAGITACGAVTSEGKVYTWGKNTNNRLLQKVDLIQSPMIVNELKSHHIISIHFSERHSCALTKDGSLFLWGNGSGGCLGDGDSSNHITSQPLLQKFEHSVVQSDVNFNGTMVLLSDGSLLACGSNEFGRLGLNDENKLKIFSKFERIENLPPCRYFSLGSNYTLAITLENDVYAWGFGGSGNLGINKKIKSVKIPTKVLFDVDKPILYVSAQVGEIEIQGKAKITEEGEEGPTSFACDVDGQMYGWGSPFKGKLGNCSEKVLSPKGCDELVPYKIGGLSKDKKVVTHYLENEKIVQVLSCHIHSACLADDGKLFTFGCGSDGRLGQDGFFSKGIKRRLKFYQSKPTAIETLVREKVKVQFAATSRFHMIAIGIQD